MSCLKAFSLRGPSFQTRGRGNPPDVGGGDVRVTRRQLAKKRKWNIARAASFQSQAAERRNRGRKRESLMAPTPCLVLRRGRAVAVAVLTSSPLPEARA